jgi:hypothetical protein
MIQAWARNTYDDKESHWHTFPAKYGEYLMQMVFQLVLPKFGSGRVQALFAEPRTRPKSISPNLTRT